MWKYAAGGCYCLLPGGDIWPHAETTPIIENTWHWPWCCRHQPATARLNCPGENKGWENISSFKYSWLAPSRSAQLSHHGGRPQLPRDRPVFRRVMSPGCGRSASHFGRRKWRKPTNTDSIRHILCRYQHQKLSNAHKSSLYNTDINIFKFLVVYDLDHLKRLTYCISFFNLTSILYSIIDK